jgi:hypothetical protein
MMIYEQKTQEDLKQELQQKQIIAQQHQQQRPTKTPDNTDYFIENKNICYCENAINEKSINGFKYILPTIKQDSQAEKQATIEENDYSFYKDFLEMFDTSYKRNKKQLKKDILDFVKLFKSSFYNGFIFDSEYLNSLTYKTTTQAEQKRKGKIILLIVKAMQKQKLIKSVKEKRFYYLGLAGEGLRELLKSEGELKTIDNLHTGSIKYFINLSNGKRLLIVKSSFSLSSFEEVAKTLNLAVLKYLGCKIIKEDSKNVFITYNEKNMALDKKKLSLFIDNLIREGRIYREIFLTSKDKKKGSISINNFSRKLFKRFYTKNAYILQKPKDRAIKTLTIKDILEAMQTQQTTQ